MKFYDLLTQHRLPQFAESPKTAVLSERELGKQMPRGSIVFARGGTLELNRKIVRTRGVHVLLDPFASGQMSVDTAVLQIAKDNDVSIGIGLRQFLESHGLRRVRLLVNYRKLVRLCVKMRNRVVIVSDARDEFQARPPLQLEAFGVWLGLTHPQAKWSLSEVPEYIVEEAGE